MSELILIHTVIYLRGEVSFSTVTKLRHQLLNLIHSDVTTLDCSGITKVNSSVTALLFVALKIAKKVKTNIAILGLPVAVNNLIMLYDLQALNPRSTHVKSG